MVSHNFDVLVVGEINPDLILTTTETLELEYGQIEQIVENASLTTGSSSVIFACGAARLGLRVKFRGICGDDTFGRFMLSSMEAYGIDISSIIMDSQSQTGVSVILDRKKDRATLTYLGCMASLQAEQIPNELLETSKHIHVSSFYLQNQLQPGIPDLFRRAQNLGLTTSLDTNWDPTLAWHGVRDVLKYTNVFLPNEAEIIAISGISDPIAAAVSLSSQSTILAVKLGDRGAFGIQGGQIVKVQAIPTNLVDTVGAGDSFDAGFIYGYLNTWELERSIQIGVVCGGLSTQAAGGTEAQPTIEKALRLMTYFHR